MADRSAILYISGTLPTRSETFVYREIFALRDLGLVVHTASVHAPASGLGTPDLDRMASESIAVYSRGVIGILLDGAAEFIRNPVRSASTLAMAFTDALTGRDVPAARRPKIIWQAVGGLSLARRTRDRGISLIHAHMAHVPTSIAMYAARQLGVPFSFTGHANDLFPNRTLLAEKLRRAVRVHCISDWHRQFYQSIVNRPDRDYPVVRCGVDTAAFPVSSPTRRDELSVLAVGRLVEKKGFDVLVEALGDIARAGGPRIRARIAGGGEGEGRLRSLISSLPHGAQVELLGDTPNDRVMELMAEADVFVIPCRVARSGDRDGIPVVLMEAMARGRCVVSGDLETIRELVRDGETGLMIPPGDRAALAETLTDLATDRDRVERLGLAGRKWVEEEFDLRVNAGRIMAALGVEPRQSEQETGS